MKTNLKFISVIIAVACVIYFLIVFFLSVQYKASPDLNPAFEKQIAKALNLHFVNSDTLYRSSFTRIFNDTIVGYQSNENPDSCFYYIKSLKNLKHKKHVYVKQLVQGCDRCPPCPVCITSIDCYRNGCLYSGRFGNSFMLRVCSDGTITNLFTKYSGLLFYANKILLYKNKAIIISFSGVFIFDMLSEKLLWKYNYDLNNGLSTIIENKLIFTFHDEKDRNHVKTFIQCINLDNFKILWLKEIKNTVTYDVHQWGGASQEILYNNNNKIVVPTRKSLLVLDLVNGAIKWQYDWNDPFFQYPSYAVNGNQIYFSTGKAIMCYNIETNKKKWQIENAFLNGIYKSIIIGQTTDYKTYEIIDSSTGKVRDKITNPYIKELNMIFVNDYILIHRIKLYK